MGQTEAPVGEVTGGLHTSNAAPATRVAKAERTASLVYIVLSGLSDARL